FFFFQAEDGIRDPLVTGVQTCALPICQRMADRHISYPRWSRPIRLISAPRARVRQISSRASNAAISMPTIAEEPSPTGRQIPRRSEERRVGKEGKSSNRAEHKKKNIE